MSSRRIERLVIRAPDRSLVQRGQLLIEDALRTASVPGDGSHRVVFVRRLDLGVIQQDAPRTSVSLAVERALARAPLHAVAATATLPYATDAVVFEDPIAPLVALARRVVDGADTTAWLWPLVAPGFDTGDSQQDRLRCVLAAALASETPALAASMIVLCLAEDGQLGLLGIVLRPEEGEVLFDRCGWTRPATPRDLVDQTSEADLRAAHRSAEISVARGPATTSTAAALAALAQKWGAEDARLSWVATALALASLPGRAVLPDLPRRAEAWLLEVLAEASAHPDVDTSSDSPTWPSRETDRHREVAATSSPGPAVEAPATDAPSSDEPAATRAQAQSAEDPRIDARRVTESGSLPLAPGAEAQSGEARLTADEHTTATPLEPLPFSAHAGLLFLVPVLERLGMAAALENEPDGVEARLPTRILLAVAERLGLPDDDPMREALVLPVSDDATDTLLRELSFAPGSLWRALGLPSVRAVGIDAVVDSWLRATRLWCRQRAGIALHALVRRPGRVAMTDTHIDVCFDLSVVDMRVRRAGLDLDPGLVSWLGYVILFHYGDPEFVDPAALRQGRRVRRR